MSRRWIITGASRGIGLATARRAVAAGDRVALVARGEEVVAAAHDLGAGALAIRADITVESDLRRIAEFVGRQWGGVDCLVNNAGLHRGGRIAALDRQAWDDVLKTNLTGPFLVIKALEGMIADGGAIVNIGAVVGFRGFPGDAPYGASKAGLAGLTRVLAIEFARRPVRDNLVVPGFVPTDMTAEISDKARLRLIEQIPMRRVGSEAEIAEVVFWVAGSTYMTGAVIPADGGLLCAL
jgi:NAD(P)-dependent dehydrogenase (short-subunit alcohol dehydrogenase family)